MRTDKTFLSVLATLIILSAIFFVIVRVTGRGRNRVRCCSVR
jgi:preprotein translocase subunit SecE